MTALRIAPGLNLPLDAVTQIIGIVARRGAGKTHTAVVFAEELLKSSMQVVVLDPLGVWWGLRSSIDGKHEGYPVVVFGGDRGDVPLTESMGAQVADVIVERTLSAVIDLSTMSKSAARRFATAFAERIYEAKQPEAKRTPLHLFVDEADLFMPQRVQPDQARMLGAFESFPRRGRVRGFGVTMITQRPATLNKDCLTQCEVLITLQITGPQDRKAVLEWVEAHDDGNHRAEFLQSLASLKRGEAWVWSPSWLNIFQRVQVRQRQTYDSSRTPTVGHKSTAPKHLAPVDLVALRADLKQVIEQQEQNDPAKLKARISALERELKALPARAHKGMIQPEQLAKACQEVEAKIVKQLKGWIKARSADLRASVLAIIGQQSEVMEETLWKAIEQVHTVAASASKTHASEDMLSKVFPQPLTGPGARGYEETEETLDKGPRSILTALAQAGRPRTQEYVGIAAGYSCTSGTFKTYLSRLRSNQYISGRGDALEITGAGKHALGDYDPLPTGTDLVDYWISRLDKGPSSILGVVVDKYPDSVPPAYVGQETGYSPTSGTFKTYLSRLRTLRLIDGRGDIRASDELMGGT